MSTSGKGISSEYAPESIYLLELYNHCELALGALKVLMIGIDHWNNNIRAEPVRFSSPAEQIRSAYSFLSHTTIVGRYLFLGDRKGKRKRLTELRCARLQYILDADDQSYPHIRGLALRYDWEHLDERLDEFFDAWDGSEFTCEPIRIIEKNPKKNNLILLGIDPVDLRLYHANEYADLGPIEQELCDINSRINEGYKKLKAGGINPLYQK